MTADPWHEGAASSCRRSFQFGNPLPESREGLLRAADRVQAGRRDAEELLRPPTPRRCRIPEPARHEAVLPEAIEREVDSGERHGPAGGLLDLACDGDAIGIVAHAKNGEYDHQLEVGQKPLGHLIAHYEERLVNWQAEKTAQRVGAPNDSGPCYGVSGNYWYVNVQVTGLPERLAAEAQVAVRSALAYWHADDLCIVAHRLHNGEWSLMVFDGVNMEMLKDGLADRVLRALRDLTREADGVPCEGPASEDGLSSVE